MTIPVSKIASASSIACAASSGRPASTSERARTSSGAGSVVGSTDLPSGLDAPVGVLDAADVPAREANQAACPECVPDEDVRLADLIQIRIGGLQCLVPAALPVAVVREDPALEATSRHVAEAVGETDGLFEVLERAQKVTAVPEVMRRGSNVPASPPESRGPRDLDASLEIGEAVVVVRSGDEPSR